jgi:predicted methyltransferase
MGLARVLGGMGPCVCAVAMCLGLRLPAAFSADDPIDAAIASTRMAGDREQDARRKPSELLRFLEIAPGHRVLDFYAGPGYYSELLSRVVGPTGSVLIYNNELYTQAAHHELLLRLARKRLRNAKRLNAPSNYLPLDSESLDRVLFVQVYHDIYWQPRDAAEPMGDAQKVLAILYRALKPNGLIVVLDHAANQTSRDSLTSVANRTHRIDPKVVIEDFAAAGFEFVGESAALRNVGDDHSKSVFDPSVRHHTDQFIYKFRKPAKGAAKKL